MALSACGGDAVDAGIAEAERALAAGDYATAQSLCDDITPADNGLTDMRASQLGRLSIIYLKLDERTDDGSNAERATRCYRAAFKVDPDSASIFYRHLPPQEYALSETLRRLCDHGDTAGEAGYASDGDAVGSQPAGGHE